MSYLGIDYGKVRVGLAISDGKLASKYKELKIKSLADALKKTLAVIEKEKIDTVVVGMPESGEAKTIADQFIKKLEKAVKDKVKVEKVDETLTSKHANRIMIELGVGQKKRQHQNITAAAILLQDYLDLHK